MKIGSAWSNRQLSLKPRRLSLLQLCLTSKAKAASTSRHFEHNILLYSDNIPQLQCAKPCFFGHECLHMFQCSLPCKYPRGHDPSIPCDCLCGHESIHIGNIDIHAAYDEKQSRCLQCLRDVTNKKITSSSVRPRTHATSAPICDHCAMKAMIDVDCIICSGLTGATFKDENMLVLWLP